MILEETLKKAQGSDDTPNDPVYADGSKEVQMVIIKDPSGQSLIEDQFVDTLMDESKSPDPQH